MITFDQSQKALDKLLRQLAVLSGDELGAADAAWQDIVREAIINVECLGDYLRKQLDNPGTFGCFPEVRIDEKNPQSAWTS